MKALLWNPQAEAVTTVAAMKAWYYQHAGLSSSRGIADGNGLRFTVGGGAKPPKKNVNDSDCHWYVQPSRRSAVCRRSLTRYLTRILGFGTASCMLVAIGYSRCVGASAQSCFVAESLT